MPAILPRRDRDVIVGRALNFSGAADVPKTEKRIVKM